MILLAVLVKRIFIQGVSLFRLAVELYPYIELFFIAWTSMKTFEPQKIHLGNGKALFTGIIKSENWSDLVVIWVTVSLNRNGSAAVCETLWQPFWHKLPHSPRSELPNSLCSSFWCLFWTSVSRLHHISMPKCIEVVPCDWLICYLSYKVIKHFTQSSAQWAFKSFKSYELVLGRLKKASVV